ncbi:P2Y purinoceptor 4-like [Rhinophrynus dorsalis]
MLNISENITICHPYELHIVIPIFVSLLFFVGLILNGISLWIFWFHIKPWNSSVILQFNLAVSDAIVSPAAPLITAYSFTDEWIFGTFLCQFTVFFLFINIYGSICFLTLISVQRYFTITHNVKNTVFTRKSFITKFCLVAWGCLCLQGIPFFILLKSSEVDGVSKCLNIHQMEHSDFFFICNWIIMFTGLIFPFAVIIVCYGLLSRYILRVNPMNSVSKIMMSKSIRMIGISLAIFIICYIPMHIARTTAVTVARFYPTFCSLLVNIEVVYYFTWMLSVFNCCWDPILYCFASKKFKNIFIKRMVRLVNKSAVNHGPYPYNLDLQIIPDLKQKDRSYLYTMSMEPEGDISPDVLRCTVCLDDYRPYGPLKPRILPVCLHTFCEGCLDRLGVDNAYSISCPICRVFNDVFGKDGIQALPINSRVPYFESCEEEMEESDLLDFIDPNMPSCPVCDSMTLYAPFGLEADITQCHTCQWVSVEVLEIRGMDEVPGTLPTTEERNRILPQKQPNGYPLQGPERQTPRRKTLLRRAISYLRKLFLSR